MQVLSVQNLLRSSGILYLGTTTVIAWVLEPSSIRGGGRVSTQKRSAESSLCLAKGLNRAKNKQGDLKRKLEIAKKQKKAAEETDGNDQDQSSSAQEIRERNDRLRFEELLKQSSVSAAVLNDFSADGYLTREQEEEEINAARAGVERLFEGDSAPTDCFEELVSIKSENAIGKTGKERLVPWLHKNSARHQDYLVVLCDPRPKSPEFRQTILNLRVDLPSDLYSRLIFINADSPAENRRWLKKNNLQDNVDVYADEKFQWMGAYTALGEKRWSMTMFIIKDGIVSRLAREVDLYGASRTIRNAVKSLGEARL
jgi:hypothetical protein